MWAIGLMLLCQYLWEFGEGPFYAGYTRLSTAHYAVICLYATFADLLIAAGGYAVVAIMWRSLRWPLHRRCVRPTIVWLIVGLATTFYLERRALAAGEWAYKTWQPTVDKVGIIPLLQWIVVPLLVMTLFRWRWSGAE